MTKRTALFLAALGVSAVVGCYTGTPIDLNRPADGTDTKTEPTDPVGTEPGGSDGGVEPLGVPCDVAKVLETSCTSCHGAELDNGAPNRLVTYEDLVAPSEDDPELSVAALSVERMKATRRPMPPAGALPAAQIAVLEKWVEAGMPKGASCEPPAVSRDAGPGDAGVKDAAPDATSVCSSNVRAEAGAPPSPFMKPGKKCIACHSNAGGPSYQFAGTVYKTLHEPDDCQGVHGGAGSGVSILLIDAAGKTHTIPVNEAGNFYRVTSMPMPYRAMVVKGTSVREMKTPQTDGDCNGCHSEWGNRAPGRIMAP